MSLDTQQEPFEDWERVLMILYVASGTQHPRWSQPELFAKILGWDQQRVDRALAFCVEHGYAGRTPR